MADRVDTHSGVTVTNEAFLDDRKKFWSFFTGLVTGGVIFLVVLMILMAIFLA